MKQTMDRQTEIADQAERLIADFGNDAPQEAWRISANYASERLHARDFDFWYDVAQLLATL
jgi:hypothetical protein